MTDGRVERKNLKLIPDRKRSTRLNTTVLSMLIPTPCGKGDQRAIEWLRELVCSWDCNGIIRWAERHMVHLHYRAWGGHEDTTSCWISCHSGSLCCFKKPRKAKIISILLCMDTEWIDPLILLHRECQIFHLILRFSSKIASFDGFQHLRGYYQALIKNNWTITTNGELST